MRVWIEALLDNEAVVPSDHRKRNITPPPPYFKPAESDEGSVSSSTAPPPAATRRRSTRSASPSKRLGTSTPRKTRASKAKDSPLKKEVAPATIAEDDEEAVALTNTETTTTLTTTESIPVLTNGNIPESGLSMTTPVKSDPAFSVEVDEEVETNGDVEVRTTHVKVELPAECELPTTGDTEDMIAKAREMVAEACKADSISKASVASKKRKAGEIATADDEEDEEEDGERDSRHVKKSRTVVEEELKRERVKTKALIGLSTVLAIG